MISFELEAVHEIFQLFIVTAADYDIRLNIIKRVNDIHATGTDNALRRFSTKLGIRYTLDKISYGHERTRIYSLNTVQSSDFQCSIHDGNKFFYLGPHHLSPVRHRQAD